MRECGERQHWREGEKRSEREQKKEGEREREKEKEGEGEGELSLFYSHFLLFSKMYASLHICFWTHSDDVATLLPYSSLSHSLSHFLSISSSHTHPLSLSSQLVTYAVGCKIYLSHFSPLLSLFLSHLYFPSHPLFNHTHVHTLFSITPFVHSRTHTRSLSNTHSHTHSHTCTFNFSLNSLSYTPLHTHANIHFFPEAS